MRVYLPKHRDENGLVHTGRTFVIELTLDDIRRRVSSGLRDRRQALALGRRIEELAACRIGGEPPDAALTRWLEGLPRRLRERLAVIGLLDRRRLAAGKPLVEHVEDWHRGLVAKGCTAQHANLVANRVRRVFEGCRFVYWSHIRSAAVQQFLADLRADRTDAKGEVRRGISYQSSNWHLAACKAFARWMQREGRVSENPLAFLDGLNVALDRRHDRRAFNDDELARLIRAAEQGPALKGVSGPNRAVLYLTAVGTGFRANELRSLTPESFHCDGNPPTVTVEAGYSKRRRRDVQPIRRDLAERLRGFLAGKQPGDAVFIVPHDTAGMLRRDLVAAGIPYVDEAGRFADFHALRHTYVSRLVQSGANIKVAQELARHSTPTLTLGRYAHIALLDQRKALDALPAIGAANIIEAEVQKPAKSA